MSSSSIAPCLATTPLLGYLTSRFTRAVKPAYNRNRELFDEQVLALSEKRPAAEHWRHQ
jgi:hypothetical protein